MAMRVAARPLCLLLAFCSVFYCDSFFTLAQARVADSALRRAGPETPPVSQDAPGGPSRAVLCAATGLRFYHVDGQLSTRQFTDASANVTDTYTFDAFGVTLAQSGSSSNHYLYAGEQLDLNVGFYYLRARYFSHTLGRFVSRDPISGVAHDPLTLHRYLYGSVDPTNQRDPSGLFTLVELLIVIAIILILITLFVWTIGSVFFGRELNETELQAIWLSIQLLEGSNNPTMNDKAKTLRGIFGSAEKPPNFEALHEKTQVLGFARLGNLYLNNPPGSKIIEFNDDAFFDLNSYERAILLAGEVDHFDGTPDSRDLQIDFDKLKQAFVDEFRDAIGNLDNIRDFAHAGQKAAPIK